MVVGPVETSGRFAYLHRTFEELVLVTPSFAGGRLEFQTDHVPVGVDPLDLIVSPDKRLVFVINAGDQTLSMVDVENLEVIERELPSDYDTLTIGPSSRFVVAHYRDAEAGGAGDTVFRNQNEITIFDLNPNAEAESEPLSQIDMRVLSLRSTPLGFDFAPPFTIQGETHHLLVVRADSALTLVDMTAVDEVDVQRRVFFVPEDSSRQLVPQRVLFTQDDVYDDYDMKMFVLASTSQDIFEVSILPPGADDEHSLALSINQFPGGPSPVEMLSFVDRVGDQKLLILNGNQRQLVVVDVDTGNSTEIDINWTMTNAIQYRLADEESSVEEEWAVLYHPRYSTVLYVNLSQLEARGTRAIIPRTLSRAVESIHLVPVSGADKAIAVHSSSTALSVLDLAHHFDIPLPGSATLSNIAFSPGGDYLFTTVSERAVLAIIELSNGHPSQVDLPEAGGRIAVMADPQVILVDHVATEGRCTLLDGVEPAEDTSLTVSGLFLEDLFAQAQ